MFEAFSIGIIILILTTTLYFLVLAYLCFGWSKRAHPESRFAIGFLLSSIYTFKFFLRALVITVIIGITLELIEPFDLFNF
jgi:hypothetical protein